jgi:DNA-binding transcriptional LysR family regulator
MQLDMNLLVALDVLLEEGSVGGAASRMHVSSPAMSRTLDRIRHMTGDAILVRAGRHMMPTLYAVGIRDEVHQVVMRAQAVLVQQQRFDVANLERIFTIQCHDALAGVLGPILLKTMRQVAPAVSLRVLAEVAADSHDLRYGAVDLHIGAAISPKPDVMHEVIGEDYLEVAMRTNHPLAGRKLTPRNYAAADHVNVSRRGRLQDPIDGILADLGLIRRVVASAPTVAAALGMASATDALIVIPRNACATFIKALNMTSTALPFNVPRLPIVATWHRRHDGDRAHVWLRTQVGQAVKRMLKGASMSSD